MASGKPAKKKAAKKKKQAKKQAKPAFKARSVFLLPFTYFALACTYDLKQVETMPARIEILDRNGNILKNSQGREIGYLHGKNRRLVTYDEVAPPPRK